MKNFLILALVAACSLSRAAASMIAIEAAYATNGVIVAVPVQLPVVGVRLDTQQVVFNLYGADTATRNACGYFEVIRFNRAAAPTNSVVASRSWALEEGYCVEKLTFKERPKKKYALSRRKIAELVTSLGMGEQFMSYVNSDPVVATRWFSTEKLVAESEEMRPFIEAFGAMVNMPYTNAVQLLEGCYED